MKQTLLLMLGMFLLNLQAFTQEVINESNNENVSADQTRKNPIQESAELQLPHQQHDSNSTGQFNITKPFKRTTFNEREIRKIKFKELKGVLLSAQDEEINQSMRSFATKRTIVNAGAITGTAFIVASPIIGLVVISATALVSAGSKKQLTRMMLRYNEVASGAASQ